MVHGHGMEWRVFTPRPISCSLSLGPMNIIINESICCQKSLRRFCGHACLCLSAADEPWSYRATLTSRIRTATTQPCNQSRQSPFPTKVQKVVVYCPNYHSLLLTLKQILLCECHLVFEGLLDWSHGRT